MVEEVRTMMKMTGVGHVALVYTALALLSYLASDGFSKGAPLIFTFPVVMLGLLSLNTRMPLRKRFFTSASFFLVAVALYQWSMKPRQLELNTMLILTSHLCYLASFVRSVRQWWRSLAITTAFGLAIFMWAMFADLFRSLPLLVLLCCTTSISIAVSFVAAGSVWKGSHFVYTTADTAALARFLGLFLMFACNVALLSNQFARHTNRFTWYLNASYYVSQFLLFHANERAF